MIITAKEAKRKVKAFRTKQEKEKVQEIKRLAEDALPSILKEIDKIINESVNEGKDTAEFNFEAWMYPEKSYDQTIKCLRSKGFFVTEDKDQQWIEIRWKEYEPLADQPE